MRAQGQAAVEAEEVEALRSESEMLQQTLRDLAQVGSSRTEAGYDGPGLAGSVESPAARQAGQ